MSGKVKCSSCGWSWNKSDSSKKDMYICHECGRDNSNNMKNGGWLDKFDVGGDTDPFGLATAKTDATSVKAPAPKLLKTKEQIKREAELEKARLAAEVAKRQTYLSADNTTPEQRAANRTRVRQENFINNAPLTQSLEAMSTTPGLGSIAAQTITEMNPAMSIARIVETAKNPANNPYGISSDAGIFQNTLGTLGLVGDAFDFGNMLSPAAKMAGSYLDQAVYPTRTYRSSVPGGNPTIYESSALADKVAGKGDWTTSDLGEATQYLSGSEVRGGRPGLLTGQDMNFTEYKVPFWKKSVASDADVIELKKLQGDVPNPNEYIIPDNKFLYPRRTNTIPAVPENVKGATFTTPYGEQATYYDPGMMPLGASSTQFRSPAYKYIEDQINGVTGQQMPLTHTLEQAATDQIPMYNWQQPQIAPNAGMGEFSGLGDYLTTQTPLANAYKINPFAFKPAEGMMFRGLGEEGYQDALQSGVFRSKQNVEPSMIGGLNMAKSFGTNPYFTPKFKTAESYGSKYLAEVPESAANWRQRYKRTDWSQVTDRAIPINEGRILQKDWLQGYKPVKENGGWLEKYEDGGELNYNDYSVSAPEGFMGDGYSNEGRDYSPAWGGQFAMGGSLPGATGMMYARYEDGGPIKKFLQPTQTFMNLGYNPIEKGLSTEYSTTVGKDGEYYLVPGFKQGRLVEYPEDLFNQTGEHLGGPFKTIQSAEDFAKFRHKYVEQNKNIPAPFKTRDYAMGGSIPGSVGFTYARTGSIPSNGKYAKKTKASAQNGTEMKYYQEGLDFQPRSMDDGGVVEDFLTPIVNAGKSAVNYIGGLFDDDVKPTPAPAPVAPKKVKAAPKRDTYDTLVDLGTNNAQWKSLYERLDKEEVDYETDKNRIKLNTGRFRGANVSSQLIDDIAAAAKRNNIPVGQLLTLAGRESTFGEEKGNSRHGFNKNSYTSGWNVAEQYQPYDPHRFLADKKVPGISVVKGVHGYGYEVTDANALRQYLTKNPQLLEKYKKKLESTPDIGNKNYFDLSAEFLKKKGVKGYNPGDPKYTQMFQKDYDTLRQDKELMAYLKKRGYKYENGGELTKLDQLTNFTNYNTKQPGGWLDKYQ